MGRQLACEELKLREGGGMPQDERFDANGWLKDNVTQGERVEVWKVQLGEGQLGRGTKIDIAMKGELREGVLRRNEDVEAEGSPELGG